ncbi:TAXI family TRAP transporter solute-binding subunit [Bradyrhizobium sp. JYMT SZCCT0180]|uniref:TAXI family TRAP transporter solute-binding subunit n=1 Tax=Bradyrhizobium sp. JYMT SZCCT0180 TaxID=2807666 RepID=UPI001BAD036D|nr:TAXI family TRAP transporter solute-binding subunit [Bradyrhizobium sp. JYMT SZCCT0180]MBR1214742.1 C4-dicarboxylate ABC transporter substrate-binding protein [Bradyrhizobium sp. JYMT SZCCT0180]
MSAEAPTPRPGMPRRLRMPVVKSNRSQIVLFSILTLVLTAATVWAGRTWVRNAETLVFAVGQANGPEARFAARLATVLKNNSSRLRLKIVPNSDSAKAIAQFDRKEANLAILRTDAKIPPRARAVAILEHDVLLLVSPAGKKIKTLAELKKKKIAVVAENESSVTLIRTILDLSEGPAAARVQMAPPGTTLDKLLTTSGFGAVIAVVHASRTVKDKNFEQIARRGTFALNAIDAAKALTRKYPVLSEETIESGTLSASPTIPEEDVETVGLQWLLVAQSGLSTPTVSDLARIIYENKSELALDGGFASKIEPAATDKDAFIVAHPGATEYINDESKSFIERYSDLMYVALAALGIIGSLFAALYAKVTRIAPERASELATAVLDVGERIADARSFDALDELQDELEAILRRVVMGMRDGTISGDGMDTFKLGYEFVRDEIGMRRDHLKRHPPPHDDKVVAVKTVQSA